MSKIGGIQKMMNGINRNQQKRDWRLLISKVGREFKEPDWSMSVKKIDVYMEQIAKENGITTNEFFGQG